MKSLSVLGALAALCLAGCTPDLPTDIASVFIEAPPSTGPSMKLFVELPVSGLRIPVITTALVKAESVLNTEVVEAGPQDMRQVFLLVQVDRKSGADILQYTAEAVGKQLVLVVNDTAVGIMRIEGQIVDGNLLFHVEQKGLSNRAAATELSKRLNASILKIRKLQEHEGK
ncbi:MAG: hypothetical protein RLZZ412_1646 [Verrucomicrobiota bacterium]|jgi:hypothetical protein